MTTRGKSLDADIAVVGAGVAGLTAARELQARGERLILLEASDRIGGRAYTEFLEPAMPFDLGAHWIHSDSINPFTQIARQFGAVLKTEQGHYVSGNYFENDHWLPESARDEFLQYFEEQFLRISESVKDSDDKSVLEVIDNDSRWAPYFHLFFAQNYVCDEDMISVRDAAAYIERGRDLAVASGLGNLVTAWGNDVPVSLNSAVTEIDATGPHIRITTRKGVLTVSKIILTVSTGVLAARQIRFSPELPDWKLDAIRDLPMGSCTRVALKFANPILAALPDDFTIRDGDDDPVHFRNRPCGHDYLEIAAGGRLGEWLEKSGEGAALDFILGSLRHVLGNHATPAVQRKIISAWDGDEWTRGSYSYAVPGAQQQRCRLAQPVDGRIFFAGEAASADYYATVHGACFSAQAALSMI